MRRLVMLIAVLALALGACNSDSTSDTGPVEGTDRCEEADPLVLDHIRGGLTVDTVTIDWGFTVKSNDYPDVWIVTAAGEGEAYGEGYGTWAIQAAVWPDQYVATLAVDEVAKAITNFGEESGLIVTPNTDGYRSAQACTIARLDAG